MIKRSLAVVFVLFLATILYVSVAHADVNFKAGATFRLRQEIWDDVVALDTANTGSNCGQKLFPSQDPALGEGRISVRSLALYAQTCKRDEVF